MHLVPSRTSPASPCYHIVALSFAGFLSSQKSMSGTVGALASGNVGALAGFSCRFSWMETKFSSYSCHDDTALVAVQKDLTVWEAATVVTVKQNIFISLFSCT